jgi:hypothetical protein
MVTRTLDAGMVHAAGDLGGWRVTTLESSKGFARVARRHGLTEVVVGETGIAATGMGTYSAQASVTCTPGGHATVLTREAPPAILVTLSGHRTSPAQPGAASLERLAPGERLVVLSSAAFEEMPEALVDLLCNHPVKLLASPAATLLPSIFEVVGKGAGAIIERSPDHHQLAGGHR